MGPFHSLFHVGLNRGRGQNEKSIFKSLNRVSFKAFYLPSDNWVRMGMRWNIGFDLEMDYLNYFPGTQSVLDSEQISQWEFEGNLEATCLWASSAACGLGPWRLFLIWLSPVTLDTSDSRGQQGISGIRPALYCLQITQTRFYWENLAYLFILQAPYTQDRLSRQTVKEQLVDFARFQWPLLFSRFFEVTKFSGNLWSLGVEDRYKINREGLVQHW